MPEFNGVKFSDSDIMNLDDWIPLGETNPHNVRPFLLHDHGFVLAVCFAECLQDAIDIAADSGKLDHFLIDENDTDYTEADYENGRIEFIGNYGKPADLENVQFLELPNCKRSFCAQWAQQFGGA